MPSETPAVLTASSIDTIQRILAGRIVWCPLPAPTDQLFANSRREEFARLASSTWPLLAVLALLICGGGYKFFYTELRTAAGQQWWLGALIEVLLVSTLVLVLQRPRLQQHYQIVLLVGGSFCLAIPIFATMALDNARLVRMTSYLCMLFINIQMLTLRQSLRFAAAGCISGIALALLLAIGLGKQPDWPMLVWFCGGSFIVTLFIGAILERQERISFLQSLLLEHDAAERARLNQELDRMAHQDALTGLANRRHFDLLLEREWERLRREEHPLAALFIDVDHFKKYNDTYGHAAGDECLTAIGGVLADAARRPGDVAARYGGEEFIILLPNTDIGGALEVAERIISDIDALQIPNTSSSTSEYVTVSIGLCLKTPQSHDAAAEILLQADQALYEAKSAGRHQVVIAGEKISAL
jgi:diguanylate cyclase (GGDEF)-like protein